MAPEKQAELYDDEANKFIFCYWDVCTGIPELTLV
jgi:hypothetical protein